MTLAHGELPEICVIFSCFFSFITLNLPRVFRAQIKPAILSSPPPVQSGLAQELLKISDIERVGEVKLQSYHPWRLTASSPWAPVPLGADLFRLGLFLSSSTRDGGDFGAAGVMTLSFAGDQHTWCCHKWAFPIRRLSSWHIVHPQ